ncbi:MAG: DUF1992 domain-containing protein [Syntrophomonadaceae bacterium]|jgi:hypothetical protein|nr:DUF1992 domain-containing protein [Syntrophomonadaceae bacterium]
MSKSIEEEIKIKAGKAKKLARYMSSTEDLVEQQILKAQERGEFNNLSGAGKRLNLDENPFEPPELRMPFKILKDNGFAPYWIELGKEIDRDLEEFKKEVELFKKYTNIFFKDKKHSHGAMQRYENKKEHFYFERKLDLEIITKKIIDYNLACPTFRVGRANITVEEELTKVKSAIESLIEELSNK